MSSIQLKDFQKEAVESLLKKVKNQLDMNGSQLSRLVFQAPTGAGKTVMIGDFLEKMFEWNKELVVIWASIGDGALHLQSKEKLKKQLPSDVKILTGEESITGNGIELVGKTIVTISWDEVNKKKGNGEWNNVIMRDGEKLNFRELIKNTSSSRKIILIIDEAHIGSKTLRTHELIEVLSPSLILEVTATPRYNELKKLKESGDAVEQWVIFSDGKNEKKYYSGYCVSTARVSEEGLICKRLVVNYDLEFNPSEAEPQTSTDLILNKAFETHSRLKKGYAKYGINPLLLIQIPNGADGEYIKEKALEFFKLKNISLENGNLNIWLTNEHIISSTLTYLQSEVEVLIFKQAINTGWDCPRAKVLAQFRDVKTEDTQTQTVGRILRMPQQRHYDGADEECLNQAYLYTDCKINFDEKIKELGVFKDLSSKRLEQLDSPLKSFTQYRSQSSALRVEDFSPFLKKSLVRHFKLDFNSYAGDGKNKKMLESKCMPLTTKQSVVELQKVVFNVQDSLEATSIEKFLVLKEKKQTELECKKILKPLLSKYGNYHQNYQTLFKVLMDVVHHHIDSSISRVDMPFSIQSHIVSNKGNWEMCLKEALKEYESKQIEELELNNEYFKDWLLPEKMYYSQETSELIDSKKYVYDQCYLHKGRKETEKRFENVLEASEKVEWWYKNGDSGGEHLRLVTENGKMFYPDYLVRTKECLWLYEVKGYGHENIDQSIEEKARALEKYIRKYQPQGLKVKGAIISSSGASWYEYKTGKGEPFNSIHCWEATNLFENKEN